MFKSVLAFSKRMDGYKRNRGKSFPPGYLVPSGSGHRWIHWPAMLQHLMIWCRWRHAYLQDDCLSWRLAHCVGMLTAGKTHQEKRQIHLPFRLLHPLSWTERIPHGQGCLPPATTWQCSDSIYLFIDGVRSWALSPCGFRILQGITQNWRYQNAAQYLIFKYIPQTLIPL